MTEKIPYGLTPNEAEAIRSGRQRGVGQVAGISAVAMARAKDDDFDPVNNPLHFATFVDQIPLRLGLRDEDLGDRFDASLDTVQRWMAGQGMPAPSVRQNVFTYLHALATEHALKGRELAEHESIKVSLRRGGEAQQAILNRGEIAKAIARLWEVEIRHESVRVRSW